MTDEKQVYGAIIFTLIESVTSSFGSYATVRNWGVRIAITTGTQALIYMENLLPSLIQIRS